ncbi:hypothetical protein QOZ80_5BG0439690 [Eleusine coracana subsp. coracana]|nr:hypothetical protein QOZ80_5BG0439690 [Eleusine coracana subsp. coracana]
MESKCTRFRALEKATKYFSEEHLLGEDVYGKVYKGTLGTGEEIAVRLLSIGKLGLDDVGFQNEFHNIVKLRHRNLVRYISYCYETRHLPKYYEGREDVVEETLRAFCFDYMPNWSLDLHVFQNGTLQSDESCGLDWGYRFRIIKGIF